MVTDGSPAFPQCLEPGRGQRAAGRPQEALIER